MTAVGKPEIETQRLVVALFRQLGYDYLGDWHERQNTRNIEGDHLRLFLAGRGHDPAIISNTIFEIVNGSGANACPQISLAASR